MADSNAHFHLFKPSGKWGYSGRGFVSEHVFGKFSHVDQRGQLLHDNDEKMPGINGTGDGYVVVVLLDDDVPYGFPLMLRPTL